MRTFLLRPFFTLLDQEIPLRINEPLGLEYLASAISDEHDVFIYDCVAQNPRKIKKSGDLYQVGSDEEDILKAIDIFKPEVIGIHAPFYSQALNTRKISRAVKERFPKIKIIIGGAYPSSYQEKVLEEDPCIDIAVVGKGEIILKNLLDNNLKNPEEIKGIIFKDKNQIVSNPCEEVIKNLDSILFPDRNLVDLGSYNQFLGLPNNIKSRFKQFLMKHKPCRPLYYRVHSSRKPVDKIPRASIITSRGCPNRCTFCSIRQTWGSAYRMRSAGNLLEEIFLLVRNYGISFLDIVDDNFTSSKKRILEVCQGIIGNNLNITIGMSSGVYLPSIDGEVLKDLKAAGLKEIFFAIENGNQEILRNIIRKNIDLKHAREIIGYSKSIGLKTNSFFILGYPGETKATMIDTVLYAHTSGLDRARFHIYQPFPNTESYQYALDRGYLIEKPNLKNLRMKTNHPLIKTEYFGPRDVLEIKQIAESIMAERNLSKYQSSLQEILKRPPQ